MSILHYVAAEIQLSLTRWGLPKRPPQTPCCVLWAEVKGRTQGLDPLEATLLHQGDLGLTPLSLHRLICQLGIITVPTALGCFQY